MVLAYKGDESLGKSDESDSEGTLINNRLNAVILFEILASEPEGTHQKRELFLESRLLEVEPFIELFCSYAHSPIKFVEECAYSFLHVLDAHALDGEPYDIYSCE